MNLTKFYFNTMKGAPILASEWGSLLDVIRTIAVTGFNELVVQAYQQEGLYLTLTFAEDHGYLKDQIIALSGSEQEEINSEFEVFATTLSTIKIKIPSDTPVTGSLTCKTAGMGWTEVFTGEHKAVFRAKNTLNNPFYLRVDDSCPIGYDPTWAKFARVTSSDGILSIDDFGDYTKAPFDISRASDVNELGDKVAGSKGIFGWAKWYHGVNLSSYIVENVTSGQSSNLNYEILGDNSSLYLLNQISSETDDRSLYCFTPFIKMNSKDKFNCLLSASEGYRAAEDSGQHYTSHGRNNSWSSNDYEGKYCLANYNGISQTVTRLAPVSLNLSNSIQYSGRSSSIPFPNPSDNSVIFQEILLKESSSGGLRGTLPLIRWIHNNWIYGDKFVMSKEDTKYIILANNYMDDGKTSLFSFKLERGPI